MACVNNDQEIKGMRQSKNKKKFTVKIRINLDINFFSHILEQRNWFFEYLLIRHMYLPQYLFPTFQKVN